MKYSILVLFLILFNSCSKRKDFYLAYPGITYNKAVNLWGEPYDCKDTETGKIYNWYESDIVFSLSFDENQAASTSILIGKSPQSQFSLEEKWEFIEKITDTKRELWLIDRVLENGDTVYFYKDVEALISDTFSGVMIVKRADLG
ncbi:MAG: hypothetical protein NE328_24045 [Lentisphaeraceae bacterium]|nr:hypothetical protein [Lentisphaeraceae bacterium]